METSCGAGHSLEIAKKINGKGLLIGIDRDLEALETAKNKLSNFNNIKYVHGNHDNIKEILEKMQIEGADGILLDLGVSSYQIDNEMRGFSYIQENAPLDMRMDKTEGFSAYDIVNTYSEEELSRILTEYGEEKFAKRIAKNICLTRKEKALKKTGELVEIVKKSIPMKFQERRTPSKKNFSGN